MTPRRYVLLVEDDADCLASLEIVLVSFDYDVRSAGNGREALSLLELAPADIVLTDIKMPLMGGLELARELRRRPETVRLPIVAITALKADLVGEPNERLFNRILRKPIVVSRLLTAMDELL